MCNTGSNPCKVNSSKKNHCLLILTLIDLSNGPLEDVRLKRKLLQTK